MVRAAFVQVQTAEIRLVVREALAGGQLAYLDAACDASAVAIAIIEVSPDRHCSGEFPAWLQRANVPRIAVCARSSEELAIEALRQGFVDYLRAPVSIRDVAAAVERVLPRSEASQRQALGGIIGDSASMRSVRDQVLRVAPARTHILITGETGTGKELIAQAIHDLSPRRARPFVAVNCGALPDGLIESELFGHERGAFTGATQSRKGRVRQADGGTLFLDEISELDLRAQVKLLRLLETRQVQPLGGEATFPVDLRVVAASNQHLAECVRLKGFREDLFYRLNVVQLEVPPLRARSEDVPQLVASFCSRYCREFGRRSAVYSTGDLELLRTYDWPGNVRELRNVVEASFVHSSGRTEAQLELPPVISAVLQKQGAVDERQRVVAALFATRWNVSRAAHRLSCSRMTLYRKMLQYQLRRPSTNEAAIA